MEVKFCVGSKKPHSKKQCVIELRGDKKLIESLKTCIEEFVEKRDYEIY